MTVAVGSPAVEATGDAREVEDVDATAPLTQEELTEDPEIMEAVIAEDLTETEDGEKGVPAKEGVG